MPLPMTAIFRRRDSSRCSNHFATSVLDRFCSSKILSLYLAHCITCHSGEVAVSRALIVLALFVSVTGPLRADGKDQVPKLVRQLKSGDTTQRRQAAEELGSLGPDARSAIRPIADALKDKDAHV